MAYKKEFTPEERAEYSERKQAEMDEIFRRIDEGVKDVFQSDKYKEYLKFASKFTDYSARNTMLINMQKPDATLVAAYGKWKQLGRQVEKGQTGISILAPAPYKTENVLEIEKPVVDEFGNQQYNPDGTEKTEKTEKPMMGIAFKPVYVFDVSQTSGKELPDPVTELTGDIDTARKEAVIAALQKVTGIDITFKEIKGGAKGYYSATNHQIVINAGMSDAQTLKTAFHEAAHNLLHDPKKNIVTAKSPRNEKEVQAESVAFIVAERFGLDTSEYSFPYIASWSDGKQLEQLKNALQEIQDAAKAISSKIESELLMLQKRNLSLDDRLTDSDLSNTQKAECIIEDCVDRGIVFGTAEQKKILDFAAKTPDIRETVKFVSDMEEIQRQRDSYGYDFSYMDAIDTKEAALEAFDRGEAVYLLYPDNTEGMAKTRSDIENFEGYFGTEKELGEELEQDSELIPVLKEIALEMWDKELDVYVDGVRAESREQIEASPAESRFYLSEYQYSAQLDFEKGNKPRNIPQSTEKEAAVSESTEPIRKNPNILGNTPYEELGDKSELQYYKNLNNRHASNIAKVLDEQGIPFSGVRKGAVTTLTVNKRDVPKYEAVVELVKKSYAENKSAKTVSQNDTVKPTAEKSSEVIGEAEPVKKNPNILGNTPYEQLGGKYELQYYKNLKNRHANNIAKLLEEQGVPFSGVRKGFVTTLTVNKRDVQKYEAIVEQVKKSYSENRTVKPAVAAPEMVFAEAVPKPSVPKPDYANVPVYTEIFATAKANDSIDAWKANKDASKACRQYINDNIHNEYESRNLKGFVQQLEEKFGIDRTLYTLSATVQLKDHDGRFTNEVKGRAAKYQFADDNQRLAYLTEVHLVMLNHLYEKLVDREKELALSAPVPEKEKLSEDFNDKFLYSSERVELRDDFRGIPETKYYNSSVNEYFVKDVGWLNNESYDREQKLSELNAKGFYDKVTRINANYIDSTGMTGQMDMSKQEYNMMTEKTYAPENAEALKSALDKLDERRVEAGGIKEKPTEYYAVRQMNDRKFAICSISADGLVTVAKPHISSLTEAKKAMLEIFELKKYSARCEFVHPQTLDEKSAELFINQSKELPEVTYRICLNTNPALNDTHFLQKYTKNADDTYKIDGVVCRGDYDKCNAALSETLQPDFHKQFEEQKKPDFEIYQLKSSVETRDLRFEPYDRLTEHGGKVDFNNYDKVYGGSNAILPTNNGELLSKLESVYQKFNIDHPDDFKGHSLSVSDVVVMQDKAYYVDRVGFVPLKEFTPIEKSVAKEQENAATVPEKQKPHKMKI